MKTELMNITPAIARDLLGKNTRNRNVRNSHVETLRASFERGEYRVTHQGIAFDENGEMIDGQHRLIAISLLDGGIFPMLVTTGLQASVFGSIDATIAKRSVADALGEDKRIAEIGVLVCRVCLSIKGAVPPAQAKPFVDYVRDEASELLAFSPRATRVWSSAPVKTAAVLAMKIKPASADYVLTTYRAMVLAHFDDMPSSGKSMFRANLNGRVAASASVDMLLRCLKIFDIKQRNLSFVRIINAKTELDAVREFVLGQMPGADKKKAPAKAEAKSVSGNDYRLPSAAPLNCSSPQAH